MDKKLIDQFGSEILCYKLKTARQKKRDVKTAHERFLLGLHRERMQITEQQKKLGYLDLDPPIIKGWKRYFVLRDDVARSKAAPFYQKILDKINKVEYCNRKDFKRKPKYLKKRKNWEPIKQTVLHPEHSAFVKMNFSEKGKALFEEKYVKHKWRNELVKVYVFKEQWRFVLRIRQKQITKVKAVDELLEQREDEIRDYLEKTNKRNELNRLLGQSNRRWKDWDNSEKAKYRFRKQTLAEMLDDLDLP
ncbi:MAG: hypothetical protein ABIX01_18800 [Chitinophagaceae bacterium]